MVKSQLDLYFSVCCHGMIIGSILTSYCSRVLIPHSCWKNWWTPSISPLFDLLPHSYLQISLATVEVHPVRPLIIHRCTVFIYSIWDSGAEDDAAIVFALESKFWVVILYLLQRKMPEILMSIMGQVEEGTFQLNSRKTFSHGRKDSMFVVAVDAL